MNFVMDFNIFVLKVLGEMKLRNIHLCHSNYFYFCVFFAVQFKAFTENYASKFF